MSERYYVGLAATLHDPALAIVGPGGDLLFAEASERPLQDKRAFNAPPDHILRSVSQIRAFCPADAEIVAGIGWSAGLLTRLRAAALTELPLLSTLFGGLRSRLLAGRDHLVAPMTDYASLASALTASLSQAGVNLQWHGLLREPPRRYDHHLAHAAAACFSSPFHAAGEDALCAVVDGFGEWGATAFYAFSDGKLEILCPRRPRRPSQRASLGMFYATVCSLCGFDPVCGEEWKVMGLAAYGKPDPALYERLRPLLRVDDLELGLGCESAEYRARFEALTPIRRKPGSSPLDAADLAATGQAIFEDVMAELLGNLHARGSGDCDRLVLTGGCALNSAWNGRILERTPFGSLHVPSAPADDGTAIGAALLAYCEDHSEAPRAPALASPYLGSEPSPRSVEALLASGGLAHIELVKGEITRRTAELLAAGRIVGWMQGRAEFGPRALGHRCILADPRDPAMKERVNRAVKFREAYRPFAPAILHEHGADWFSPYCEAPYMERSQRIRPEVRAKIPAVVHVDGTGRAQSVRRETTPRFHALIEDFHAITGVPLLLSTSFNTMGRPMVHSVEDAVATFLTSGIDVLVIGDTLAWKEGAA